jgi:glyoxylase I family protein
MTSLTGVAHVTLSVRDHDRSLAWYGNLFGVKPIATEKTDLWTRSVCAHAESGLVFVLIEHADQRPEPFNHRQAGLDHISLSVPDKAALDAWQARLHEQRITFTSATATARGALVVNFKDPDGIALELTCPVEDA